MNLIQILKKSWKDAGESKHSSLNKYNEEKGPQKSNLQMPKYECFEKEVFEELSKVYGCGLKKILIDLYIPSEGHSCDNTQLDVVFINKSGIYVVEAKHYYGIVEGRDTDKNWIGTMYNGSKSERENPVKQNTNHINNLKNLLSSYESEYFKNIVVIADSCEIKYESNSILSYETKVVNFSKVKDTIKFMSKNSKTMLDDESIYKIYNQLSGYARCSEEVRSKHIEQIEKMKKQK